MEQVITASAKVVREILPTIKPEEKKQGYKQLRVAAYCRVSTDSDEQEMSFEAQVGYYTDKIMRNPEWSLAGIYADEGISGTQAEETKRLYANDPPMQKRKYRPRDYQIGIPLRKEHGGLPELCQRTESTRHPDYLRKRRTQHHARDQ